MMGTTKQLPSSRLLNGYSRFFEFSLIDLAFAPLAAVKDARDESDLGPGPALLVLLVSLPFTCAAGMALFVLATLASVAVAATMLLTVPAALVANCLS